MAIGDLYIPLQISGEKLIKDMDRTFTQDGKSVRVVVKDFRIVSEELVFDGDAMASTGKDIQLDNQRGD
jgi:hypothetical protein